MSSKNFNALKLLCNKAKFVLQEGKICDRINERIGGNSTCPPPWGGVRGGDKYSIAKRYL